MERERNLATRIVALLNEKNKLSQIPLSSQYHHQQKQKQKNPSPTQVMSKQERKNK